MEEADEAGSSLGWGAAMIEMERNRGMYLSLRESPAGEPGIRINEKERAARVHPWSIGVSPV